MGSVVLGAGHQHDALERARRRVDRRNGVHQQVAVSDDVLRVVGRWARTGGRRRRTGAWRPRDRSGSPQRRRDRADPRRCGAPAARPRRAGATDPPPANPAGPQASQRGSARYALGADDGGGTHVPIVHQNGFMRATLGGWPPSPPTPRCPRGLNGVSRPAKNLMFRRKVSGERPTTVLAQRTCPPLHWSAILSLSHPGRGGQMPLTPEEGRRLHVLSLLERGQITTAQAAEALEITPRQIRRLRGTLRQAGPAGLAHRSRERRAHNRLATPLRAQVVALPRAGMRGSTMCTSPRSSPPSRGCPSAARRSADLAGRRGRVPAPPPPPAAPESPPPAGPGRAAVPARWEPLRVVWPDPARLQSPRGH